MTSITWASPRYVQELTTILAPQNRTQGSCEYVYSTCKLLTVPVPNPWLRVRCGWCQVQEEGGLVLTLPLISAAQTNITT